MKLFSIALILSLVLTAVYAAPVDDYEPTQTQRALRQRRITCDLLTFGGIVNDSACAFNCHSLGKAGGTCQNGICVCRRDTLEKVLSDDIERRKTTKLPSWVKQ